VKQWYPAAVEAAGLEMPMATKNKGGKNVKKAAARDLKQKRADKKAKRSAKGDQSKLL
jgi:hypothetical protein